MDSARHLLRHTLATLAYRGGKAILNAPEGFSSIRAGTTTRQASEILAHLGDLLDWASSMAKGKPVWSPQAPRSWSEDVERFFAAIHELDGFLASDLPMSCTPEQMFQGPIADALTHVGQIATLRRLAGAPVRGENYFKAEITVGRVGADQSTNRLEFD